MSIEGDREKTDSRRGAGIYDRLVANMDEFQRRHLMFGASVTVTKENIESVLSEEFIDVLSKRGCKLMIYVEYVPVSGDTEKLAPTDTEREYLRTRVSELRKSYDYTMFLSFPGDEKESGGCFAAGRAFFHINSHGGAEPCPFSPYSDINVRDTSLREAINSKLFRTLRSGELLAAEHDGGCVLYEKRAQVEAILAAN
jgi:MoaA/NifB/PqqE/SkfB family radical SAM enzyme